MSNGITVQYPSQLEGSYQTGLRLDSTDGEKSDTIWINEDVLLLQVDNGLGDPNQFTVSVFDDHDNTTTTATGTLTWQDGDTSTQYIEFRHFPSFEVPNPPPSYEIRYTMSVVNVVDWKRTDVEVSFFVGDLPQ